MEKGIFKMKKGNNNWLYIFDSLNLKYLFANNNFKSLHPCFYFDFLIFLSIIKFKDKIY